MYNINEVQIFCYLYIVLFVKRTHAVKQNPKGTPSGEHSSVGATAFVVPESPSSNELKLFELL
jgi:hypothetical protein